MRQITTIPCFQDRAYNRWIVQFLRFIQIVTARIPGSMIMGEVWVILTNGADNIPFHNLHMINVVQQLDAWRVHQLTHLNSPRCFITLVIRVIHLAIQQLQDQRYPRILSSLCYTPQALCRDLYSGRIIQPTTITAEANEIRNAPLFCQRNALKNLSLNALVVLAPVQPLADRHMPTCRGDGESILFNKRPILLSNKLHCSITDLGCCRQQFFRLDIIARIAPPAKGLFETTHILPLVPVAIYVHPRLSACSSNIHILSQPHVASSSLSSGTAFVKEQ